MKITHLKNKAINYDRWDYCIKQSHNQLTYAFTWYLDVVSPGWEALVSGDYEYVMPLPLKSRYNFPYLVQPVLTQQLGIFSEKEINESIVEAFIKEIPYFSYELNLNEHNFYEKALIYPNFLLNLNQPFNNISASYSKNIKRNVEKASKLNLRIQQNLAEDIFLSFYFSVDKHFLSPKQPVLENLIKKGILNGALNIYGVYSADNKLIAGLCLLKSSVRITYLLPVSNSEGKSSAAMFLLINYLIRENAGNEIIFDFEGSQIEGVARLYSGFGAKNYPYYILKRFRPSFLIRN